MLYFTTGSTSKAAVKAIVGWENMNRLEKKEYQSLFEKEIKIHFPLQHPNIVQLLGICQQPTLCSIMEYAFLNLSHFVEFEDDVNHTVYNLRHFLTHLDDYGASDMFSEKFDLHTIAAIDVARGLQYLHSNDIAHRDLKPRNILVSGCNERIWCKLTDFGESRSIMVQTASIHTRTAVVNRGTVVFNAPEILLNTFPTPGAGLDDFKKADVWSYGMVIFCLLNPELPYPWSNEVAGNGANFKNIIIEKMHEKVLPSHSNAILNKEHLLNCFSNCCKFIASSRPNMETIVQALSLNLRTIVTNPSEQNDMGPDLSNTPSRSDDVLFCTETRIAPPGANIGLSSKPLVTGTTSPGTYARANISETEEESALISKNGGSTLTETERGATLSSHNSDTTPPDLPARITTPESDAGNAPAAEDEGTPGITLPDGYPAVAGMEG